MMPFRRFLLGSFILVLIRSEFVINDNNGQEMHVKRGRRQTDSEERVAGSSPADEDEEGLLSSSPAHQDDSFSIDVTPEDVRDVTDVADVTPDEDTVDAGTDDIEDNTDFCQTLNYTNCTQDHHKYYKALYIDDSSLWVELCPEEKSTLTGTKHVELSDSTTKRGYMTTAHLALDNFLFYGIPVENITILTGGFLHIGPLLFQQIITRTQYVAPFMGNFNPSLGPYSNIYYYSDEDRFIVQWEKVQLDDQPDYGNFSFQVQLHSNNDIVFAYKDIPMVDIPSARHENAIGLSDAYHIINPNRVVINVYHELKLNKSKIASGKAVRLVHLKLCTMLTDCYSCTSETLSDFECFWCPAVGKCTDRFGDSDFHKWYQNGCSINFKKKGQMCEEYCYYPEDAANTTYTPPMNVSHPVLPAQTDGGSELRVDCEEGFSVSNRHAITANDIYTCTTGGSALPKCEASCSYTEAPAHGVLQGAVVGHLLKPDASFPIVCDVGWRLKSRDVQSVTCVDGGVLDPDPANVRCEKYCTIHHAPNSVLRPAPTDPGFLHEGETATIICDDGYILEDFYAGTSPDSTVTLTCDEEAIVSSDTSVNCVGYCEITTRHPNTTYHPSKPLVGDEITIECSNGSGMYHPAAKELYSCERPGYLSLPFCHWFPLDHEVDNLKQKGTSKSSLIILLAIFILTIVSVVGGWGMYAYRNPTSPSGLFLIEKCRPWTWRSAHSYRRHEETIGEAYYLDGGI